MMVAAIKGNIRDASDGKPKYIENLYNQQFHIFGSKSEGKEQLIGFEM